MNNVDKLSALAWEAHRRGMAYGDLVANTTDEEKEAVYATFEQDRKTRKKTKPAKREAPPLTVIHPDHTKRRAGETAKEFRSRRVREGMEEARAKGARLGRPPLVPTLTSRKT